MRLSHFILSACLVLFKIFFIMLSDILEILIFALQLFIYIIYIAVLSGNWIIQRRKIVQEF